MKQPYRLRWNRNLLALASLAMISLLLCAPTIGVGQQTQIDLPILKQKFGRSPQQADFIIVVDTSGSMKKFWNPIKSGVADFVDAISEGDYISTIYFEAATGELFLPRKVSATNRQALKAEILALGEPKGRATDLGLGVDRTIDELNRPNPNRLQFVFFFTDFKHDPPAGSKYSRDCAASAWKALQEKKTRLIDGQNRVVKIFALKLPLDQEAGRDLGLFQCVFNDIEQVIVTDSASLRDWFERKKNEIERDKLRIQVANEMKKGVSLSIGNGDAGASKIKNGLPLIITSQAEYLDIEVNSIAVTGADERGELMTMPVSAQPFTLGPGEHKGIKLDLQARGGWAWQLEKCEDYFMRTDVKVTTALQPASEISILMTAPATSYANTFATTVLYCKGIPWWWLALALLGVAIIGGVMHRQWGRAEMLTGTIIVRKGASADKPFEVFGRKSLLVGNTKNCTVNSDKFGTEKLIEIEFIGRKPKWFTGKPRRGVYVRVKKGAGKMQVERLDESTNEYKREWVGLPTEFANSDEPIHTGTMIQAGDGKVEWQ